MSDPSADTAPAAPAAAAAPAAPAAPAAVLVVPTSPAPADPTPSALAELLGSKKLVMALLALFCALAAHLGLHFTPEQAFEWVSPFLAAILAQGVADHGKSAELVRSLTYRSGRSAGSAPAPSTASLKVAGTGAGLGILFLLAMGAASSHGCGPATQQIFAAP